MLFFHKYQRIPHVVTGFITSTVTKQNCAKIACKHSVNIQTSEDFFTRCMKKKGSFTYGRLSSNVTAKAWKKSHSETSIYQSGPPQTTLVQGFRSNPSSFHNPSRSVFSLYFQTGKRIPTGRLGSKGGSTLRPLSAHGS